MYTGVLEEVFSSEIPPCVNRLICHCLVTIGMHKGYIGFLDLLILDDGLILI